MIPQAEINPAITVALARVEAAKQSLAADVAEVQAFCEHEVVSEAPYDKFGNFRICNHCRAQEEGTHWSGGKSWTQVDHGPTILGNANGRLVLPISRDELFKMRVR